MNITFGELIGLLDDNAKIRLHEHTNEGDWDDNCITAYSNFGEVPCKYLKYKVSNIRADAYYDDELEIEIYNF